MVTNSFKKLKLKATTCIKFIFEHGIVRSVLYMLAYCLMPLIFIVVGKRGTVWYNAKIKKSDNKYEAKKKKQGNRKKVYEEKENLLAQWKNHWGTKDLFLNTFEANYRFTIHKLEENKRKNFFWKKIFIFVLFVEVVGFLGVMAWTVYKQDDFFMELLKNSLALVILVLLSGIIAKWLDVKKYQETWARHSNCQYLLEREMLLFIFDMPPYDIPKKKEAFIWSVVKIWDANQAKFVSNLEDKEVTMMDIFKNLKSHDE